MVLKAWHLYLSKCDLLFGMRPNRDYFSPISSGLRLTINSIIKYFFQVLMKTILTKRYPSKLRKIRNLLVIHNITRPQIRDLTAARGDETRRGGTRTPTHLPRTPLFDLHPLNSLGFLTDTIYITL